MVKTQARDGMGSAGMLQTELEFSSFVLTTNIGKIILQSKKLLFQKHLVHRIPVSDLFE